MRPARTGLAIAATAALLGCRSYKARPLDLPAHREAWLARSPSAEGVAAFARRLAAEPGAPSAYDVGDGLSLREGEAVALFFNPDLRLARLAADAALADSQHAGRWEDPELGVDAERILESVQDPWVFGATVAITLPVSGRLAVEKSRARAAHRAELARVLAQEWATRLALRAAWFEWSAHRHRAELSAELVQRLRSIVDVVGRLEQAGEMSRLEARLFRIELASRAAALRTADARTRALELQLKAIMGLAPGAPVTLLPAALAGAAPPDDTDAAMEGRNPALAALRAEHDVAEQALRLEIRKQYPDITIAPGWGTEDGDPRVLLGLSLPIPLWNRNQRAIAEADAQREIARAAFETEFERLAGQLAAAHLGLEAARAERVALETEVVPMVEEQDAEARRVAELGEVDTLLLLESLTRLYDTKAALIDARLAEALAAARLDELIGPPPAPPAPPTPAPPAANVQTEGADR